MKKLFAFVMLLIPGLMGLLMLQLVWSHELEKMRFAARATQVQGRVVAVSVEQCSRQVTLSSGLTRTETYTCYEPEVGYEHQGQAHSTRLKSERSRERLEIGAPVPLLIGTGDDEPQIRIRSSPHWVVYLVTFLGLMCLGFTVFFESRLLSSKKP